MSYEQKLHRILTAAACEPTALADKEVWDWQQQWRRVYAEELHAARGTWIYDGYDWHVFSWSFRACVERDKAWNKFRAIEPCDFRVVSAWDRHTFGFACHGKPPERLEAGIDVLVFPITLEWTMAFTHETGLHGPYFAER